MEREKVKQNKQKKKDVINVSIKRPFSHYILLAFCENVWYMACIYYYRDFYR